MRYKRHILVRNPNTQVWDVFKDVEMPEIWDLATPSQEFVDENMIAQGFGTSQEAKEFVKKGGG